MKRLSLILLFWLSLFVSVQASIKQGMWHAMLQLNDSVALPFNFESKENSIEFINAEERIEVKDIKYAGDSVFIRFAVYDVEIRCRIKGDSLKGRFINHTRPTNNIFDFKAAYGNCEPLVNSFELKNFEGRWDATFADGNPPLNKAVGEFKQKGNRVTGTFLTPTGDYSFLDGFADGNTMYLSRFDGSFLFYFTATMGDDGTLTGHYFSGSHWHDTWMAKRDEKAELPNPDSLAFLKKGFDRLSFSFPDLDSNIVSLSDSKFRGKVVLITVMGTWCPNCIDETAHLAPFYKQYQNKGFEIIGLDYERIATLQYARSNLKRLIDKYDIDYTILFAGSTDRENRARSLPQISGTIAFPTTIFLDKKGRVRKIHTGFSGPATGEAYEKWKEDLEQFIQKLLAEK